MGSGGANDVASGANESLVTMIQTRDRMVQKVPYITSPGRRIKTLVTTMAVYEKLDGDDELTLTAVLADSSNPNKDALVRNAKDNCGWDLKLAAEISVVPMPERKDISALRLWDPKGQFLSKLS